jgi:probable rRNA maturation factor
MTIFFENESDIRFDFSIEEQLDLLISHVTDYVKCPYEAEVSVTMVTKEQIHEMNHQFRQVDRHTDVLSFPMMEYGEPADFESSEFQESITISPESGELVLGDIVLCGEVIKEQAEEYGHSELREFSFLVVHSMLHLFGFDHMEPDEREVMEHHQRIIMEQLNITR